MTVEGLQETQPGVGGGGVVLPGNTLCTDDADDRTNQQIGSPIHVEPASMGELLLMVPSKESEGTAEEGKAKELELETNEREAKTNGDEHFETIDMSFKSQLGADNNTASGNDVVEKQDNEQLAKSLSSFHFVGDEQRVQMEWQTWEG